jgi:hypothetical protein
MPNTSTMYGTGPPTDVPDYLSATGKVRVGKKYQRYRFPSRDYNVYLKFWDANSDERCLLLDRFRADMRRRRRNKRCTFKRWNPADGGAALTRAEKAIRRGPRRVVRSYAKVKLNGLVFSRLGARGETSSTSHAGAVVRWLDDNNAVHRTFGLIERIIRPRETKNHPYTVMVKLKCMQTIRSGSDSKHGLPLVEVVGPRHAVNVFPWVGLLNLELDNVMFFPQVPAHTQSTDIKTVHTDVRKAPVGTRFYAIRKVQCCMHRLPCLDGIYTMHHGVHMLSPVL